MMHGRRKEHAPGFLSHPLSCAGTGERVAPLSLGAVVRSPRHAVESLLVVDLDSAETDPRPLSNSACWIRLDRMLGYGTVPSRSAQR